MINSRIGHFAGNTELYLCEREAGINTPKQHCLDFFFFNYALVCNQQLSIMWRRNLHVLPFWLLAPIKMVNQLIPGGEEHEIDNSTLHDRDIHNLLDQIPKHLEFTPEEERLGRAGLSEMGVPINTPFVCLQVRDSSYLSAHDPSFDASHHDYRDSDIQNYVLAAEELAARGYVVVRMGAVVKQAIKTTHPNVIDYAVNGQRNDFMDIYLGAKCLFSISTGTGWDTVPAWLFRRPMVGTNLAPIGYLPTFSTEFLLLPKRYVQIEGHKELSLSEIFYSGLEQCLKSSVYHSKGIKLKENSPEEIRDIVVEMVDRLNGAWRPLHDDEALQSSFWKLFPTGAIDAETGRPLHGEVRARLGAQFLRDNQEWLQ